MGELAALHLAWLQQELGEHVLSEHGRIEGGLTGVSIDSRTVQPGELFVAIAGPHHDGHDHVSQAVNRGAAALLVSRLPATDLGVPVLQVKETQAALTTAATAWRRLVNPRVVAVTGSSGKSTIKEMTAACLRQRFITSATRGNLNNHLGVPLTLLRMSATCQALVVEMGMSAAGEIAHLTRVAEPEIGIVSNVHPAHLGSFARTEEIARAKGELPAGLPVHGLAILPHDQPFAELLQQMAHCPVRTFGLTPHQGKKPDVWAEAVCHEGFGLSFTLGRQEEKWSVRLHHTGDYMVLNALAAAEAARQLGVTAAEIAEGLSTFRLLSGRGEALQGRNGWVVVDSTYNANPGSVAAALDALAQLPTRGRRVALLGDMLELGEQGEALHAALAERVAAAGVSLLLTAGPLMAALHQAAQSLSGVSCHHCSDPAAWLGSVAPLLQADDVILVKGSRGMRMERLLVELMEPVEQ